MMLPHGLDEAIPGIDRIDVMEAVEALRSRRELLGPGLVDVHAAAREPADAAARLVVDPDAAAVPYHFVLWIHGASAGTWVSDEPSLAANNLYGRNGFRPMRRDAGVQPRRSP